MLGLQKYPFFFVSYPALASLGIRLPGPGGAAATRLRFSFVAPEPDTGYLLRRPTSPRQATCRRVRRAASFGLAAGGTRAPGSRPGGRPGGRPEREGGNHPGLSSWQKARRIEDLSISHSALKNRLISALPSTEELSKAPPPLAHRRPPRALLGDCDGREGSGSAATGALVSQKTETFSLAI